MGYRSKTEIISQILESAMGNEGARRTQIMYNAYLSNIQLKEYLAILTEGDLLSYDGYTRKFRITEKGLRYLEVYDRMYVMVNEEEQQEREEEQKIRA